MTFVKVTHVVLSRIADFEPKLNFKFSEVKI